MPLVKFYMLWEPTDASKKVAYLAWIIRTLTQRTPFFVLRESVLTLHATDRAERTAGDTHTPVCLSVASTSGLHDTPVVIPTLHILGNRNIWLTEYSLYICTMYDHYIGWYEQQTGVSYHTTLNDRESHVTALIGSILNPLAGKVSKDTLAKRRVKARKQGHLTIGGAFVCRNMIG